LALISGAILTGVNAGLAAPLGQAVGGKSKALNYGGVAKPLAEAEGFS